MEEIKKENPTIASMDVLLEFCLKYTKEQFLNIQTDHFFLDILNILLLCFGMAYFYHTEHPLDPIINSTH